MVDNKISYLNQIKIIDNSGHLCYAALAIYRLYQEKMSDNEFLNCLFKIPVDKESYFKILFDEEGNYEVSLAVLKSLIELIEPDNKTLLNYINNLISQENICFEILEIEAEIDKLKGQKQKILKAYQEAKSATRPNQFDYHRNVYKDALSKNRVAIDNVHFKKMLKIRDYHNLGGEND